LGGERESRRRFDIGDRDRDRDCDRGPREIRPGGDREELLLSLPICFTTGEYVVRRLSREQSYTRNGRTRKGTEKWTG